MILKTNKEVYRQLPEETLIPSVAILRGSRVPGYMYISRKKVYHIHNDNNFCGSWPEGLLRHSGEWGWYCLSLNENNVDEDFIGFDLDATLFMGEL